MNHNFKKSFVRNLVKALPYDLTRLSLYICTPSFHSSLASFLEPLNKLEELIVIYGQDGESKTKLVMPYQSEFTHIYPYQSLSSSDFPLTKV